MSEWVGLPKWRFVSYLLPPPILLTHIQNRWWWLHVKKNRYTESMEASTSAEIEIAPKHRNSHLTEGRRHFD